MTRSRADDDTTPATAFYPIVFNPIAFAMIRGILPGIKERAERLAAGDGVDQPTSDAAPAFPQLAGVGIAV